jgi:hypothetical protein
MKKILLITLFFLLALMLFSCSPGSIDIHIVPAGAGTVEQVDNGDGTITLTAIPNEGYRFDQWTGDFESYVNAYPVPVDGSMSITANFVEHVIEEITYDFETGDTSGWTLGGAEDPHVQTDYNPDGSTYAVQFGQVETDGTTDDTAPIDRLEESWMEVTNISLTNGTISFDYKVSTENVLFDYLAFYLYEEGSYDDYDYVSKFGGVEDWTNYVYEVPEDGTYNIRFRYRKDSIYSQEMDCVWINNISFVSMPPVPEITVSGAEDGGSMTRKVVADEPANIKFNISNVGKDTLYLEEADVSNGDFTVTQPDSFELAPGESTELILTITLGVDETADTDIKIYSNDSDETPYDISLTVEGVDQAPGWLFMMYMDGDNNLESLLWGDINEIEYGLHQMDPALAAQVHVIVLWDGCASYTSNGPDGGMLYELGPEDNENTILSANTVELTDGWFTNGDEIDVGDGDTITEFLNYCENRYPAMMNRVLIMSNHGGGVRSREVPDRYGWSDNDSGSHLYTNEIQQGIMGAGFNSSNKLSLIGHDACIMAAVEEAYEYKDVAEFFVASPENEGGDGWEFDDWMPNMSMDTDPMALSQIIVESYRDDIGGSQTLTATNLSEVGQLKIDMDNLAEQLYAEGTSAQSYFSTETNGNFCLYMGEFLKGIANDSGASSGLTAAANTALTQLGQSIVYAWSGPYNAGPYDGPGTTVQEGLVIEKSSHDWYTTDPVGEYGELDFCTTTDDGTINTWTELLNEWY